MNRILKKLAPFILSSLLLTGVAFAGDDMAGHDMSTSDRVGEIFHESMVDGHMLAYYLMDLRDQKGDGQTGHNMKDMAKNKSHDMKDREMDKPHHIMVYIMDKNHAPILKGTVGFMIKDAQGNAQKAMAMYMSKGFGITADMKKKGVYTIRTKALVGGTKLMDSFQFEMK